MRAEGESPSRILIKQSGVHRAAACKGQILGYASIAHTYLARVKPLQGGYYRRICGCAFVPGARKPPSGRAAAFSSSEPRRRASSSCPHRPCERPRGRAAWRSTARPRPGWLAVSGISIGGGGVGWRAEEDLLAEASSPPPKIPNQKPSSTSAQTKRHRATSPKSFTLTSAQTPSLKHQTPNHKS